MLYIDGASGGYGKFAEKSTKKLKTDLQNPKDGV